MEWFRTIMTTDYVRMALPFFLLAILAEFLFTRKKKLRWYRLNDSINSLSCGIINQFAIVLTKIGSVFSYGYVSAHAALTDISGFSASAQAGAAVVLFLGVDFCYYWFHRSAHRINFGWATHVVHHQSEEYNLTTALRQGAFQEVFSFPFYLPLALAGFPLPWFLAISSLNTTWQFWIHTRTIDKMPDWFEAVFNTPSHHRVHHGRNKKYLDKNHGGIFIIWDKAFGTFQSEEEPVCFGITTGLKSWNPLWAQVHYIVTLLKITWQVPGLINKLKVWVKGPSWQISGFEHLYPECEPECFFDPDVPPGSGEKAAWLFCGGLIMGVLFLYGTDNILIRLICVIAGVFLLLGAGSTLETGSVWRGKRRKMLSQKPDKSCG